MNLLLKYFRQKIGQWPSRALKGTHNHYSCFLPRNIGGISALILKLFYSGIKIDEKQTAVISQLEKDAIIVYVSKFTNYFELLFYYRRYRQLGLPFPQIGFDYKIFFWQPVLRLVEMVLSRAVFFVANRAVPAGELQAAAREWAQALVKRAPLSLAATKKVMRLAMDHDWASCFDAEAELQQSLVGCADNREGITAFFEKREAEFKGQ